LAFYTSQILRENIERLTGEQQFSTVSYIAAGLNQDLEDRFKVLETVAAGISPGTMGNAPALQKTSGTEPHAYSLVQRGTFSAG